MTDSNPEPQMSSHPGPARPGPTFSVAKEAGRALASKAAGSVELIDLHAYYGSTHAVRGVRLDFDAGRVTAIIGPSGCGKSTMVRCINRMHEETPGARAEGKVMLDGLDLYDPRIDIVAVRRSVGMVFQKPNPFPTMSIIDNVTSGLRLTGAPRAELEERGREALQGAGLWEEVKDRLDGAGSGLSGGQQQRLCIARALRSAPRCCSWMSPARRLTRLQP